MPWSQTQDPGGGDPASAPGTSAGSFPGASRRGEAWLERGCARHCPSSTPGIKLPLTPMEADAERNGQCCQSVGSPPACRSAAVLQGLATERRSRPLHSLLGQRAPGQPRCRLSSDWMAKGPHGLQERAGVAAGALQAESLSSPWATCPPVRSAAHGGGSARALGQREGHRVRG